MRMIKLIMFLLLPMLGFSQLVNDGGTITVKDGAVLHVESDVHNMNSGTLDIQGTGVLEVQGNLTNDATLTASQNSTVKFIGAGNSNLKSSSAVLGNVIMDKTNANLILVDDASIATSLDFNAANNRVVLGTNDLVLDPVASITNAATGKYVQADGTGKLVMKYNNTGVKTFEVGDVDDYSPLMVNVTSATMGANASVAVNVDDAKHTAVAGTVTDFLTRNWSHTVNDMTAYTAMTTATYVAADISGTEANIKGAAYDGANWTHTNATTAAANVVSVEVDENDVAVTAFAPQADQLLMNIKIFLQGPYSGTMMGDALRSGGLLPTTEPYTGLGYAHVGGGGEVAVATVFDLGGTSGAGATHDDIVDWVVVELRDMGDNTNILATKSALVQRDGDIVDIDGTSTLAIAAPNGDGSFFIAVRHRNHLGFMSDAARALTTTASAHDFTNGSIATYGTNALKIDGGVYMMWAGNANGNNFVGYSSPDNDVDVILNAVLNHPGNAFNSKTYQYQEYSQLDNNMNSNVGYAAPDNDVDGILNSVLNHPSNAFNSKTFQITEQLP